MKLDPCTKCQGRMTVGHIASNIFKRWLADVYCVTCGNRLTHNEMILLAARLKKKVVSFAKAKKNGKKVQPCACCEREQPIQGRGLCGACHLRHTKAGTLDELYPKRKKAA